MYLTFICLHGAESIHFNNQKAFGLKKRSNEAEKQHDVINSLTVDLGFCYKTNFYSIHLNRYTYMHLFIIYPTMKVIFKVF